jgi:DNA repair protein RadA/Sms
MFKCKECGYRTLKWLGKCPECGSWESFIKEKKEKTKSSKISYVKPQYINEIKTAGKERINTSILEFDRVIGGGVVSGSIILVSGEPGIGKSTLLLTISGILSRKKKVIYISGEESISQVRLRAERIGVLKDKILILSETDILSILACINAETPEIVIIDSVQALSSGDTDGIPGSVSMVREIASELIEVAKKNDITIFLVGHITKSGNIAGPKTLEHMVDTVLFMEGDRTHSFRLLRSKKNRFGSTNEVGIFDMDEEGLKEVKNPSEYLISGKQKSSPGSIVIPTIEGTRTIMIEAQALVIPTRFAYPQRVAQGFSERRLDLLVAVIQKRLNMDMSNFDIFCNIAGGMSILEPSIDLGVVLSVISSLLDKPIKDELCVVGEVGLSGEIRGVPYISSRIQEAKRMGFKKIITPPNVTDRTKDIEVIKVSNISQAKEICEL